MSVSILPNATAREQTFTQFLFHNSRNRFILYLAVAAIAIQFAVFKYLYPFANYMHDDSFQYLIAADRNSTIEFYPIGYSKFLRLVSVFAKPDLVLTSLQYLMIECSTLFFLFTLFYFYKPGKAIQALLFCFMILNPLSLHLGNMVSSDGLFLALSMTWFSLLLWIIFKPSKKIIVWHAIVLFAAFTVRYNALMYPFIALPAFALSKLSLRKKITGWGLGALLCGWFVGLSMFQYKKLTGYWQFSPFSGWQWANNAMYIYREVDSANLKPVPPKFRTLDNMVRNFHNRYSKMQMPEAGTAYMWTDWLPLMRYQDSLFKVKEPSANELKKWASMGPLYSSYGLFIIKKYPIHFLRYFVWPNSRKYFAPPLEFLNYYNTGQPTVSELAAKWFGYTNNQLKTRMKSGKVWILEYYPFLVSISNILLLLGCLSYILLQDWKYNPGFNKIILLTGFMWIANAGFTIFLASAALRFQSFPALLNATLSLLLIDWMAGLIQRMKTQSQQPKADSEYASVSTILTNSK